MTHPEEAALIAYALAEDAPDGRTVLAAHLAGCADCRHALGELQATLDLTASLEVPARGEAYGRDVWARLEPRLRAVRLPARRAGGAWLAAAAGLVLGLAGLPAGATSRVVVARSCCGAVARHCGLPCRTVVSAGGTADAGDRDGGEPWRDPPAGDPCRAWRSSRPRRAHARGSGERRSGRAGGR